MFASPEIRDVDTMGSQDIHERGPEHASHDPFYRKNVLIPSGPLESSLQTQSRTPSRLRTNDQFDDLQKSPSHYRYELRMYDVTSYRAAETPGVVPWDPRAMRDQN